MNTQEVITTFSKEFIDGLIEDNFFDIMYIEVHFDMKRIENVEDSGDEKERCMLCLDDVDTELIAYKCNECSCHLHHSCLNNYVKSYSITNCIQCKHMHSSVFSSIDF
jgi:hypothetical protein